MSKLGVSTLSDNVLDGMKYGGQHYFDMDELMEESGKLVAQYIKTEHALITNSASAAIVLAIAGIITKANPSFVEYLHEAGVTQPNDFLMMKGHNVDYGAPIEVMMRLGGAFPKEAGYANGCTIMQLEQAITDLTAGILFVKSHHCVQKNMPSLQEVKQLCEKHQLPLVLDAAAEEDIQAYADEADLIIFSGSKAIQGPTSGILAGKKEYVAYASGHLKGIGRAMKVGKEAIFGLLNALEQYHFEKSGSKKQLRELEKLKQLELLEGVRIAIRKDEAGRDIYRGCICIAEDKAKLNAAALVQQLKAGSTAIFTRDYHANNGSFDIDPRPLRTGDMEVIIEKIKHLLGG